VGRYWYFSAVALAGGACLTGYTVYVWGHRKASAGASLAVMLAASGWWGWPTLFWGDTKWLGIALLLRPSTPS